jgi:phage major head subunit gpT-like protein
MFNEAYSAALQQFKIERLATEVPSESDTEDYSWLGDMPSMREFLGPRVFQQLIVNHYSIRNKDWEVAIEIKRSVFEDDGKVKTIQPRIMDLAAAAARHRYKLLTQNILANNVSYDNVAMFATTHNIGGQGNQSNLLTGTGTTLAQVQADFFAARAALIAFKSESGEHFNIAPKLLVLAPPSLWGVFDQLQNATIISQTENVLKGQFELEINPYLASLSGGDANDWYLLNTLGPIKPFVFQNRRSPDLVGITDPESEHVFKHNTFLWGSSARYNVGNGLWQMAIKTTNT